MVIVEGTTVSEYPVGCLRGVRKLLSPVQIIEVELKQCRFLSRCVLSFLEVKTLGETLSHPRERFNGSLMICLM